MASKTSSILRRLESLSVTFEPEARAAKTELLRDLDRRRLASAGDVLRLHEVLCFLRAYPDDAELLALVERMVAGFTERSDLQRHARALANSGIAGTAIEARFYWHTAAWLRRRWPARLFIDWAAFKEVARLDLRLTGLMPYAENLALDETVVSVRECIRRLKSPKETDAANLIGRFEALKADGFLRESYYEELDLPCRLAPGPDTPSRTRARYAPSPVVFQRRPLVHSRRAFRPALALPSRSVKTVSPREARVLITLAREAMITRDRDLDIFVHADEKDVRMIDCGDGLQFACYGAVPERRQMLDAVYGFLMLKNGVPIGYVLCAALFGSVEIAYNIFETYRGAEAAYLLGRSMAVQRQLFGVDTFTLDPYQLGHDNREGLKSGAWWFYYKLGFRPKDPKIKELVRAELGRARGKVEYRSSIATLQRLSANNMYLHLDRPRRDVIGIFSRENVGMHVVKSMAERFGADREKGVRECSREAATLLGVRSFARFSRGERLAWDRWSPLLSVISGLALWPRSDKRALVRIVRAKGGRRESDFVTAFDSHRLLREAILKLSRSDPFGGTGEAAGQESVRSA